MGYPTSVKGYKLLDPTTNKFIISRDVSFCEIVFPFHQASTQPPSQLLFPPSLLPDIAFNNSPPNMENNTHPVVPLAVPDEVPETLPDLPAEPNDPASQDIPATIDLPAQPDIALPDQTDIEPIADQVLRRSTRPTRPPAHLDLYDCNSVSYPMQSFRSYDSLSSTFHSFINNVCTVFEPQYYHQAIRYPIW